MALIKSPCVNCSKRKMSKEVCAENCEKIKMIQNYLLKDEDQLYLIKKDSFEMQNFDFMKESSKVFYGG